MTDADRFADRRRLRSPEGERISYVRRMFTARKNDLDVERTEDAVIVAGRRYERVEAEDPPP